MTEPAPAAVDELQRLFHDIEHKRKQRHAEMLRVKRWFEKNLPKDQIVHWWVCIDSNGEAACMIHRWEQHPQIEKTFRDEGGNLMKCAQQAIAALRATPPYWWRSAP